ncbi:MAG: YfhO family protein [Gemmatimonadetes bacterium]|nr:YfhO family protein [Gemmatimonadota bacterium]
MARDGKKARKPPGNAATGGGSTSVPVDGTPSNSTLTDATPRVPMWVPAAVFIGLTVLLFRDFVFSDRMLFGGDTLGLGYVARAFYAQTLTLLGMFPRWNPEILGGTPFLEALSGGDSLYPPSLLLLLLMEPYRALGWKLVLHVAAAGFFMFGWVGAHGASRPAALLGGTAYLAAPYLVSLVYPGHDGKLFVTALTPLLFWAVERHFQRSSVRTFAAVALVIALVVLTTHFQMAYFLFGATGLYAIVRTLELWRTTGGDDAAAGPAPARGRTAGLRFGLFLAAAVAGAGVAAVQLLPAVEYVTEYSRRVQTTREAAQESGVAWSSSWSLHPEEVVGLVIPEFAGNNSGGADWSQGTYWGRNVTRDNHSGAGIVTLVLALVGLLGARRRIQRWFFAGLGVLALLFALGAHTPVWRIFYEVVPGIRLFRAPDQVMFLFAFAAATLAALGLDRMLGMRSDDASAKKVTSTLWITAGAFGGLALLAASGGLTSIWTTGFYTDIDPARLERLARLEPFIARGAWISFGLALAVGALAWMHRRALMPVGAIIGLLVSLVAIDEFRISSGFIRTLDFQQWSAPDANIRAILDRERAATEPYRLLSFAQNGQDVHPALHGIELAGGHHPNDLSRYRELIGMVGSGLPQNLLDDDIRRLLNVKYILWPDAQFGQSISGMPVVSRTALQNGTPYETVLADAGLPRARLVGGATVKSDAEAVPYMLSDAFDPEREVVLAEPSPIALDGGPPSGTVSWTSRSPNELTLSVTTERAALLVVADNWFPAWRATVDGEEAPVLRAYHTLRAVPVPAGTHEVVMRYRSDSVTRSLWISAAFLVALVGAVGFATWRERRAGREP